MMCDPCKDAGTLHFQTEFSAAPHVLAAVAYRHELCTDPITCTCQHRVRGLNLQPRLVEGDIDRKVIPDASRS